MIKKIIFISFSIFVSQLYSQTFSNVPNANFDFQLQRVLTDSVDNTLIVSSKFLTNINSLYVRGISSWNGLQWDSLSSGLDTHDTINTTASNAVVNFCMPYNGDLLVGGQFRSIGGINATSLAIWNGSQWDSLPKRAFEFDGDYAAVYGMCKYDGLLYIYGNFDSIAGQPTHSIGTWDGADFHQIILPLDYGSPLSIFDATVFNNELYICGAFNNNLVPGYRSILKFDGVSWSPVGGGIQYGSGAYLYSMVVYNNELYVGGHFLKSAGNAGDNVMKWDGSIWKDVQMDNGLSTVIFKMLVYHNQLWCFGDISSAAGLSASNIAVLDSTQWCTFNNDLFNNIILSASVYKDTIYVVGGFSEISGDSSFKYIAKIEYPDNFSGCMPLNTNEILQKKSFSLYPNPSSDNITIEMEEFNLNDPDLRITVLDVLGREVIEKKSFSIKTSINVSELSQGIYMVHVRYKDLVWSKKFVKE